MIIVSDWCYTYVYRNICMPWTGTEKDTYVKVKFTLEESVKAQGRNNGIALFFF
jgi:hypothetical protein